MLSRADVYMIKQLRQDGALLIYIAHKIGCSEKMVSRVLQRKTPASPTDSTAHSNTGTPTNSAAITSTANKTEALAQNTGHSLPSYSPGIADPLYSSDVVTRGRKILYP